MGPMLHSEPMSTARVRPPRRRRPRGPLTLAALALVPAAALLLPGCQAVGYYSQAVGGHLKLMRAREPIDELLADPDTDRSSPRSCRS